MADGTRRGQPPLAGLLPQRRPLRAASRCPQSADAEGGAPVAARRQDGPLRVARPPHPLDEHRSRPSRSRSAPSGRRSSTGRCRCTSASRPARCAARCSGSRRPRAARRSPRYVGLGAILLLAAGDGDRRASPPAPRRRDRRRGGRGVVRALLIALVALAVGAPAAHAHATLAGLLAGSAAPTLEASPRADRAGASTSRSRGRFGAIRVFDAPGRARRRRQGHARRRRHADRRRREARPGRRLVHRDLPRRLRRRASGLRRPPLQRRRGRRRPVGESVSELLGTTKAGPATGVGFGAVKAVGYLAIALALGGLLFVAAVWGPAARGAAVGGRAARRLRAPRAAACSPSPRSSAWRSTAAGIVLEGATAAGTSFWGALDASVDQRRRRHPLRRDVGAAPRHLAAARPRASSRSPSAA